MFSFTGIILTTPVPVIVPDVPDSETALPWFAQTTALEPFTLPSPDLGLRDPGGVIPPGSNGWLPSQTAAPTRLSPRELGKSRALGGRGARGPVSNRGLLSSALPSSFSSDFLIYADITLPSPFCCIHFDILFSIFFLLGTSSFGDLSVLLEISLHCSFKSIKLPSSTSPPSASL